MKSAASLLAGLALVGSASAQTHDPFDPHLNAPKMVRIQVEYIQVSQQRYLDLVANQAVTTDATAMRKQLQTMASTDQAKILETAIVHARSGERSMIESVHEFIFPTDYEPPGSLPLKFNKDQEQSRRLSRLARIPECPTSFETRNLGTTFEVAPTIGAHGQVVDLHFAPELVIPAGFAIHYEQPNFDGQIHRDRKPCFIKNAIQTAITCINGQYTLVGLTTPSDENGQLNRDQKIMIFIRCHILPVIETKPDK